MDSHRSRGAEGSASDEAAVEADQIGRALAPGEASTITEGSASGEAHPSEENRRADERGHR